MKFKRSLLFVISFLFLAVPLFTACGKTNQPKAFFTEKEFVVSLNETINFFDYLKTENVKDIVLNFGEDLLSSNEDNSYTASKSGRTMVQALHGKNVLASAKVVVKQKFSAPSGVTVDAEGNVSWQDTFVYDEAVVYPSGYQVKLDGVVQDVIGKSIQLPNQGRYTIAIKALGTDYVDESDFSEDMIVQYGVLDKPEIISFIPSRNFETESAFITWTSQVGASYDVYINGILMLQTTSNSAEFDFKNFLSYQDISLRIDAISQDSEKLSASETFVLRKAELPQLKYSFDGKDGKVIWEPCLGASEYILRYENKNNPSDFGVFTTKNCYSTLENLRQGVYFVSVQAYGGKQEDKYYLNSGVSMREFAKLDAPKLDYSVEGSRLNISFQENDYVENYLIVGNKNYEFNTKNSLSTSIDLADLQAGEYRFKVYARPTLDGENVKPLTVGSYFSSSVVNSEPVEILFYVLEEIEEISHSIINESNTLTFSEIRFATSYDVEINGQSKDTSFVVSNGEVTLTLGALSEFAPVGNQYSIKITAKRTDNKAVTTSATKTLTILDLTSRASLQQNGYYSWNEVEGDVEYYYEIYSVDKDYNIGDAITSEPIQSGSTFDLSSKEELPFGYYTIKLYSKSTNLNSYLSSDFYNKKGYFQDNFIVTKQIEQPKITFKFDEVGNRYVLTIAKVDFAGRYTIYVDGEREGAIMPTDTSLTQYTYILKDTFSSGVKEVSVVAEVYNREGATEDAVLHPASEKSSIYVTRLPVPSYTVDENEMLSIMIDENAEFLKASKDGQELSLTVSDNVAKLDLSDANKYYGNFSLSFQFKAKTEQGNNYYLDSEEYTYQFRRTSQPTNINYSNGVLTFDCQDANVVATDGKYIVTLVLVTANGNHVEYIDVKGLSFNISAYIQTKMNSSVDFADTYNQSSAIEIQVSAYKQGLFNGVYYLPSRNGKTSDGKDKLSLTQLSAPQITFDSSTMMLSWNAIGACTVYSVYVDNTAVATNIVDTRLDLSGLDFAEEKVVKVFASNASYLTSASSNEITIRRLGGVASVNVTQKGVLTFSIPTDDLAKTTEVQCNGSTDNVNFTVGNNAVSLDLNNFVLNGEVRLNLQIMAKEPDSTVENGKTIVHYYVNSVVSSYTFIDLTDKQIAITGTDNDKLTWSNITENFANATSNPVSYTLVVKEGEREVERIQDIQENSYELAQIMALLTGARTLSVEIKIADYEIKSSGVGYYSAPNEANKLNNIESIAYSFVEDLSLANQVDRKVKAKIQLSFEDIWNDEDIKFNISVNNINFLARSLGDYGDLYEITKDDNTIKILLDNTLFKVGENAIVVSALNEEGYSHAYAFKVRRFNQLLALSVSDDGILSFVPGVEDSGEGKLPNSYLIGLTAQDENLQVRTQYIYFEDVDFTKSYDLLKHFNIDIDGTTVELSGNYAVEVVAFDKDGQIISGITKKDIHGYRLSGVEVETTDSGKVNINILNQAEIDNDISFVVRKGAKNGTAVKFKGEGIVFKPYRIENSGLYEYSMIEFIELLKITDAGMVELEISVRKPSSLNAKWAKVSFKYASGDNAMKIVRGRNYAEDYLRLDEIEGEKSTSFKVVSSYLNLEGQEVSLDKTYLADEIFGYWVKDANQGFEYFAYSQPSQEAGITFTQCYAINLNDYFAEAKDGTYSISVSRVAKNSDGFHVQYNSLVFDDITKLKTVENVSLRDDRITWSAMTDGVISGYYVYFNYYENEQLVTQGFRSTTNAYLDLQNILDAGKNYEISIVTVSDVVGRLASSATVPMNASKYKEPLQLEVADGVIRFKLSEVAKSEFVEIVKKAGNVGDALYKEIALTRFTDIFTFSARTIASTNVELNFSSGGQNYRTQVRAIDLIPDLSLIAWEQGSSTLNIMSKLAAEIDGGSQVNDNYRATLELYNALVNASKGVATNQVLFSDFGNSIADGAIYNVSVRQIGRGDLNTVSSNYNVPSSMYVVSAPKLTLSSNHVESTGKNQYLMAFSPVSLLETNGSEPIEATSYVLNMKSFDGKLGYYFSIVLNSDGVFEIMTYQTATYDAFNRLQIKNENLPSSLQLTEKTGDTTSYVIDMSELSKLAGIDKTSFNASIYALGNGFSASSKSNTVRVTLLDLNLNSLTVSDGVMTLNEPSAGSGYVTKVRCMNSYGASWEQTVTFDSNKIATINLNQNGNYRYILLYILGNYTATTMVIDSPTYRISNLSKLEAPAVNAMGNIFRITQNASSKNASNLVRISNDDARARFDNNEQDVGRDYKFTYEENGELQYMSGLQNLANDSATQAQYNYKKTESKATQFYFMNIGTSLPDLHKDITSSSDAISDYDIVFKDKNNLDVEIVLSSNEITMDAKMLSISNSLRIEDGDIVWDMEQDTDLPNDHSVIYQLSVDYYIDKVGMGELNTSKTFYTALTKFDTANLPNVNEGEYYVFNLNRYVMKNGGGVNNVKTIEGDVYSYSYPGIKYSNSDIFILASEPVSLGGHEEGATSKIKRAPQPESVSTQDGYLNWKVSGNIAGLNFKVLDADGLEVGEGKYNESLKRFDFVNDKLKYNGGTPYKLNIVSYYKNDDNNSYTIKSIPTKVVFNGESDVYKLPDITRNDFTISTVESETSDITRYMVDFSKFYEKNTIRGSKMYYRIEMTIKTSKQGYNTQIVTLPSEETDNNGNIVKNIYEKFYIDIRNGGSGTDIKPSENLANSVEVNAGCNYEISFRAVDVQSTQRTIVINGNTSNAFNITPVEFDTVDIDYGVKWEETTRQFSWTYTPVDGSDASSAQFKVVITYDLAGNNTVTEELEVNTRFVKPNLLGYITKVEVYVRKDSSSLYCSNPLSETFNPNIDNRIFAGGEGTSVSPYLIANKEQFYNIQYKNSQGVYFKQLADFELNDSDENYWFGSFFGSYDGNSRRITFRTSTLKQSELKINPIGVAEISFNNVASIFKSIESGASVSNLNLSAWFGKESIMIDSNALFAGLAVTNNGNIRNVNISSIQINVSASSSVALGVSGLVCVNNGEITDCINSANVSYTTSPSYTGSFLYAGFALSNNSFSSYMTRCLNTGNVDVQLMRQNTIAYIAGVTLFNDAGKLIECGNNGSLNAKGMSTTGYTGYVGGICLRSANVGELNYCYNNGIITSVSSRYAGAIAYNLTECNIEGVVSSVSGVKVVGTSSNVAAFNCYCYAGDMYEGLEFNELTTLTISCGDGRKLIIEENEQGFFVSLE